MPEKITLADGTEREVPTEEELKNLRAGHDANASKRPVVEQFNKIKEDIGLKEGQTIEERLAEMKEAENPNWKAMREANKNYKTLLEKNGQKLDEDGNVVENEEAISKDDIKAEVRAELLEDKKESLLSPYTDEQKKSIKSVLEKLMTTGGTLEENLDLAVSKVLPGQKIDPVKQVFHNSGGNAPIRKEANSTTISDDVKELGKKMGLSDDDFNKK